MDLRIEGRLALVTGASGGLGLASALRLAEEGARLLLSDVDRGALEAALDSACEDGASADRLAAAALHSADLAEPEAVRVLADRAAGMGGVDILVHCAGITGAKGDPLAMSDDDFAAAWQVNFMSAVRLCRTLLPGMAERGWGRVVFVTSENAVQPYPEEIVYDVSKAALLAFAKGVSLAYGPRGVLVNSVMPAFIESPMTDGMMRRRAEETGEDLDEAIAGFLAEERPFLTLGRRGKPDEVAATIALLCSDIASFTNGAAYRVDGGAVASIDS